MISRAWLRINARLQFTHVRFLTHARFTSPHVDLHSRMHSFITHTRGCTDHSQFCTRLDLALAHRFASHSSLRTPLDLTHRICTSRFLPFGFSLRHSSSRCTRLPLDRGSLARAFGSLAHPLVPRRSVADHLFALIWITRIVFTSYTRAEQHNGLWIKKWMRFRLRTFSRSTHAFLVRFLCVLPGFLGRGFTFSFHLALCLCSLSFFSVTFTHFLWVTGSLRGLVCVLFRWSGQVFWILHTRHVFGPAFCTPPVHVATLFALRCHTDLHALALAFRALHAFSRLRSGWICTGSFASALDHIFSVAHALGPHLIGSAVFLVLTFCVLPVLRIMDGSRSGCVLSHMVARSALDAQSFTDLDLCARLDRGSHSPHGCLAGLPRTLRTPLLRGSAHFLRVARTHTRLVCTHCLGSPLALRIGFLSRFGSYSDSIMDHGLRISFSFSLLVAWIVCITHAHLSFSPHIVHSGSRMDRTSARTLDHAFCLTLHRLITLSHSRRWIAVAPRTHLTRLDHSRAHSFLSRTRILRLPHSRSDRLTHAHSRSSRTRSGSRIADGSSGPHGLLDRTVRALTRFAGSPGSSHSFSFRSARGWFARVFALTRICSRIVHLDTRSLVRHTSLVFATRTPHATRFALVHVSLFASSHSFAFIKPRTSPRASAWIHSHGLLVRISCVLHTLCAFFSHIAHHSHLCADRTRPRFGSDLFLCLCGLLVSHGLLGTDRIFRSRFSFASFCARCASFGSPRALHIVSRRVLNIALARLRFSLRTRSHHRFALFSLRGSSDRWFTHLFIYALCVYISFHAASALCTFWILDRIFTHSPLTHIYLSFRLRTSLHVAHTFCWILDHSCTPDPHLVRLRTSADLTHSSYGFLVVCAALCIWFAFALPRSFCSSFTGSVLPRFADHAVAHLADHAVLLRILGLSHRRISFLYHTLSRCGLRFGCTRFHLGSLWFTLFAFHIFARLSFVALTFILDHSASFMVLPHAPRLCLSGSLLTRTSLFYLVLHFWIARARALVFSFGSLWMHRDRADPHRADNALFARILFGSSFTSFRLRTARSASRSLDLSFVRTHWIVRSWITRSPPLGSLPSWILRIWFTRLPLLHITLRSRAGSFTRIARVALWFTHFARFSADRLPFVRSRGSRFRTRVALVHGSSRRIACVLVHSRMGCVMVLWIADLWICVFILFYLTSPRAFVAVWVAPRLRTASASHFLVTRAHVALRIGLRCHARTLVAALTPLHSFLDIGSSFCS